MTLCALRITLPARIEAIHTTKRILRFHIIFSFKMNSVIIPHLNY